jgi:NAD(P)-dependent dehydrogenase (short-subunit alcohol dehydrogenase family)
VTDPLFDVAGRRVLITGAGGSLGSVMARAFAERGAIVGVHDISAERVEGLVQEISASGGQAVAITGDVATAEGSADVVRQGAAALGGLDVLLNGVGINRRKPMEEVTPEDFDAIVSVNLRAIYFASQAAHAIMRPRGKGCIVNLSSLSARFSFNTISVYAATKAGVTSLTRSCAREWATDGIRVNAIEPFVIKTEFTKPLWGEDHRQRWFDHITPAGRLGVPEDLVGSVIYLASDASSWVTGQTIVLDGGLTAGADWDAFRDM